jgi:hypothetical protein
LHPWRKKYHISDAKNVTPKMGAIGFAFRFPHFIMGSSSGWINKVIERGCPGTRAMSPFFSSFNTIWWTVGGVTRKYRSMSASAGARPLIFE